MQKAKKDKSKVKKKLNKKQILIILVILIYLISFASIFGRYITNNMKNFFMRSKEFYFSSDKLSKNTSIYEIDNWSGVDDYILTINMNSRKNNLKAVDYDIGYDIKYTCSENAICQLNKTEGIIYANTNTDFFNLTITPNQQLDVGDKVIVEVEVTSKTDYRKTLKGRFTLVVGKEEISYQIDDKKKKPFMELSITNTIPFYIVQEAFNNYEVGHKIDIDTYLAFTEEEKSKCYSSKIRIDFDPNEILLDLTNENYKEATNIKTIMINQKEYINSLTIEIDAISSKNLRFYKADVSKDYTYPNGNQDSVVKITSL